jgi:septal ring factor EnvC (AmiA/AmiB activator)
VRALAAAFIAVALLAAPASAGTRDDIAAAKAALAEAENALEAAGDGEQRLAALGRAVAAQEAALATYRRGLRRIARRSADLIARVEADRGDLTRLLGALQAMSLAPPTALLAFPGGPVEAARAAMLLAQVTPELDRQRIAVAAELDGLHQLRIEQELARHERLPPHRLMRAQARAAAETAETLAALSDSLAETGGGPSTRRFDRLEGGLSLPVVGRVTGRYGDPDPWGRPGRGLTVTAPEWAQVAAPVDATVRYAGPLPGYGDVVLLEPQAGWLMILAGLGRVEREVGETVLAGERIGDLGGALPESTEIFLEDDDGGDLISPRQLYIELRREGATVDPAPWFLGRDGE